ncbi:hypothetical protein GCM10010412_048860 [Nonomuraea recticatena]|uniref:Uncharacterized protein n=1 Tax=Nonomuraea recticatena TaxID=46178 RepID=A0ABP6EJI6_9ACTN
MPDDLFADIAPKVLAAWRDRDQAVEDVDDELGRGAWLRARLVSRRSAPCAYQVTDAQRWLARRMLL